MQYKKKCFFLFDTVLRLLIFSKYKTTALFTTLIIHSMYHLLLKTVSIKNQHKKSLYNNNTIKFRGIFKNI